MPIAGGGGESEVGGRSIIKYQTDDKGTHLTFQQAMDGTYKGSVDNSTKAVTDKVLTGVSSSCIPAVKGSSNASYKNSITRGMYFDNYIPKDPDQSLQITAALLMMGNGTNTTSIWKKRLEIRQKHRILMNLQLMIKHQKSQRQIFLRTNYLRRILFM